MRELTKSMLRMSWALPLFGVKQMTHLATPTKASLEDATAAFEAVSNAAQDELGNTFKRLFDTGERLQHGVVDTTFGVLMLDALDPRRWMPGGCCSQSEPEASSPPTANPKPPPASPMPAGPIQANTTPQPSSTEPQRSEPTTQLGWGPMP